MIKQVNERDAFYHVAWSPLYRYDRYDILKVLPELTGILCVGEKARNEFEPLLIYACWRDGLRVAFRKLMDPVLSPHPHLRDRLAGHELHYRYTVVDSNAPDLQDIMFWLLQTYEPPYNEAQGFEDSKRYLNISVNETIMGKDEVVERIHGIRRS